MIERVIDEERGESTEEVISAGTDELETHGKSMESWPIIGMSYYLKNIMQ